MNIKKIKTNKRLYLVLAFLVLGICVLGLSNYAQQFFNQNKNITFDGRWFTKEIEGRTLQVTLNQGAMMYFSVENTEKIDVYFHDLLKKDTPYYAYAIDNGDMVRKQITERQITLPDKNKHLITIIIDGMYASEERWTNEHGIAFERIDCNGGKLEKVVYDKQKILFIGDSITEGIMTLGVAGNCEDNSATNSYTWHTAQQLNVEPYFLAYGGIGISEKGSFTYVSDLLDNLSSTRKTESIPECDLIVFNIGSNDVSISSKDFIQKYKDVVLDLYERYPEINILCVVPINQRHAEDIKKAVGDYDWCYVVETADWEIASFDGTHPIGEGCSDMADKLVEYIKNNNLLE